MAIYSHLYLDTAQPATLNMVWLCRNTSHASAILREQNPTASGKQRGLRANGLAIIGLRIRVILRRFRIGGLGRLGLAICRPVRTAGPGPARRLDVFVALRRVVYRLIRRIGISLFHRLDQSSDVFGRMLGSMLRRWLRRRLNSRLRNRIGRDDGFIVLDGLAILGRVIVLLLGMILLRAIAIKTRRVHQSIIMLGVLIETFGRDPVAARRSIARQLLVLFIDLRRVAPNARARTVAVKNLVARVSRLSVAAPA